MKLSDAITVDELLIWCDYLEETRGYPPEVILWLRYVIAEGLRPWDPLSLPTRSLPVKSTILRGKNWDWEFQHESNVTRPSAMGNGELPAALWLSLGSFSSSSTVFYTQRFRRREYQSAAEAWEDLVLAAVEVCKLVGLTAGQLGDYALQRPDPQGQERTCTWC